MSQQCEKQCCALTPTGDALPPRVCQRDGVSHNDGDAYQAGLRQRFRAVGKARVLNRRLREAGSHLVAPRCAARVCRGEAGAEARKEARLLLFLRGIRRILLSPRRLAPWCRVKGRQIIHCLITVSRHFTAKYTPKVILNYCLITLNLVTGDLRHEAVHRAEKLCWAEQFKHGVSRVVGEPCS